MIICHHHDKSLTTTSALKHLKACGNSGLNSIRGFEVGELWKGHVNLIESTTYHGYCYLCLLESWRIHLTEQWSWPVIVHWELFDGIVVMHTIINYEMMLHYLYDIVCSYVAISVIISHHIHRLTSQHLCFQFITSSYLLPITSSTSLLHIWSHHHFRFTSDHIISTSYLITSSSSIHILSHHHDRFTSNIIIISSSHHMLSHHHHRFISYHIIIITSHLITSSSSIHIIISASHLITSLFLLYIISSSPLHIYHIIASHFITSSSLLHILSHNYHLCFT